MTQQLRILANTWASRRRWKRKIITRIGINTHQIPNIGQTNFDALQCTKDTASKDSRLSSWKKKSDTDGKLCQSLDDWLWGRILLDRVSFQTSTTRYRHFMSQIHSTTWWSNHHAQRESPATASKLDWFWRWLWDFTSTNMELRSGRIHWRTMDQSLGSYFAAGSQTLSVQ